MKKHFCNFPVHICEDSHNLICLKYMSGRHVVDINVALLVENGAFKNCNLRVLKGIFF